MKSVTATEFKSRCLALLEEVRRNRHHLLVTRHGKPVAEIVPHCASAEEPSNPLKGSIVFEDDLISPVDIEWVNAS